MKQNETKIKMKTKTKTNNVHRKEYINRYHLYYSRTKHFAD
jgi:hypothetical protein